MVTRITTAAEADGGSFPHCECLECYTEKDTGGTVKRTRTGRTEPHQGSGARAQHGGHLRQGKSAKWMSNLGRIIGSGVPELGFGESDCLIKTQPRDDAW